MSYFWILIQYDPNFDLKIEINMHDLYCMTCNSRSSNVPYILKAIYWREEILWDNEPVLCDCGSQNKYTSHRPIFHCVVLFALYLKDVDHQTLG